jgi:hypothetical protein
MHADSMYHKLLAQEAEIEAAKAEGRPVPKFAPVVPKKPLAHTPTAELELSTEQKEMLKARLKKVDDDDRPAEIEAFKAEQRARAEMAERLRDIRGRQDADRKARRDAGQETAWDKVMGTIRGSGESK